MNSRSGLRVIVAAMVLIVSVVALSRIFTGMWGGKMEGAAAPAPLRSAVGRPLKLPTHTARVYSGV